MEPIARSTAMRTLVLDGAPAGDATAHAVRDALAARVPDGRTLAVRDLRIGNCAGDFSCWIRSPGQCNVDDDNRLVASEMMSSDQMVLLTPVTFGGYSGLLKRAVDHFIQNISPFFRSVDGETHHRPRYRHYPDPVVIGWLPQPDARDEQVFRNLVARNGINFYAQPRCDVLVGEPTADAVRERVRILLDHAHDGRPVAVPNSHLSIDRPADQSTALSPDVPDDGPAAPARRVVLLTGSPRTTTSNSHFLGGYLLERLADRGADVQEIFVHTTMASSHRRPAALAAIDAADLVVLACPLYVDSLPAPVTAALEHLRAHRRDDPRSAQQRLVALLNCGFPEPEHNATAMAIAAGAARAVGARWAGGLAVGGGEGVIGRQPLTERGRTAAPLREALDLTAAALAEGRPVPTEATRLVDHPLIPPRLYTSLGQLSWLRQAHGHHVMRRLHARPYADARAAATSRAATSRATEAGG
jgi:multimeric flavodoxin WrbA